MAARTLLIAALVLVTACKKTETPENTAEAEPQPGTREWKIRNARSAAPPMIAAQSMVVEVRDSTMALDTLERGDSASPWVCFADDRNTQPNDPVCADDQGMRFFHAWISRQPPRLTGMGVAYALQGGYTASDTDPYDMTPDSSGLLSDGPAIYIVMPTAAAYTGIPTTRRTDGPWVRFSGTPYAYIVVPAGTPASALPAGVRR